MNDIIFGIVYVLVAVYAAWGILRDKIKDRSNFIKSIVTLVLIIIMGTYIPIYRKDMQFITIKTRNILKCFFKFKDVN